MFYENLTLLKYEKTTIYIKQFIESLNIYYIDGIYINKLSYLKYICVYKSLKVKSTIDKCKKKSHLITTSHHKDLISQDITSHHITRKN